MPPMIMAQDAGHTAPLPSWRPSGKDVDGICSRTEFSSGSRWPDKPMLKEVNELFRKRSGRDFSGSSARVFVGFLTLSDAINRAGVDHATGGHPRRPGQDEHSLRISSSPPGAA